jgi:1,3-beta-glucanosyltransferase GAS1
MNELQGYPIPVFFSEDGCNLVRPRTFSDLAAVYGPEMTPIMSGSIIYEWTQEANDYGIVQYPDTCIQDGITAPVGVPVPLQPEFDNLKSAWAAASPSSIAETDYNPSTVVIECPATTSGTWTIDGNAKLPETPGNLTAKKPEKFTFTGTLSSVTVDVTGISVSVYTSGATGTIPTALSSSGSVGESGSSAQGTAASGTFPFTVVC